MARIGRAPEETRALRQDTIGGKMQDRFTTTDLESLIQKRERDCLSLFMPTVQAGPETRQNGLRYKNQLSAAEKLLRGRDVPIDPFMEPLRALAHESLFWANQSEGLVVFRSASTFLTYRLPVPFRGLLSLTDHFHIKPLLPFLRADQKFFILALSKKQVRLVECSLQHASIVEVPNMPNGSEFLGVDDPQNRLQFRSVGRRGDKKTTALFHAHGTAVDENKEDVLQYFHQVNKALEPVLKNEKAPLFLAGVEYLLPVYLETNTYPHVLDETIEGNPDGLSAEELKASVRSTMENLIQEQEQKAIADYRDRASHAPSSSDLKEVVSAAFFGRVDTLLAASDEEAWGVFDGKKNEVIRSDVMKPGYCDLIDLASVHTIQNGGTAITLTRASIPGNGQVAALFRF